MIYLIIPSGVHNGGTEVLSHIGHALEDAGKSVHTVEIGAQGFKPNGEAVIFQSQWYAFMKDYIDRFKGKKICWLEHFNPPAKYPYAKIESINADWYFTQYKGEVKDWAERQVGKAVHYLPHGACRCMKEGNAISAPEKVIIMNRNEYKDESWLEEAGVTILDDIQEELVPSYYKSANVVGNIHAEFQKGLSDDYFGMRGIGLNERPFQVIMAGGFVINDNNPAIKEFFTEQEVPMAHNKEDFKYLVNYYNSHPEERLPFMARAKRKIYEQHTYAHRIKELLDFIS